MKVVEDFESRPQKALSLVVERDKEVQEWNEQKVLQGVTWLQWRQAARKLNRKRQ